MCLKEALAALSDEQLQSWPLEKVLKSAGEDKRVRLPTGLVSRNAMCGSGDRCVA